MKHLRLLLLFFLILFQIRSFSQSHSEFEYIHSIGKFNSASSFFASDPDLFFVCDNAENEVYKLDINGKVLSYTGGYGWAKESFDDPADITSNILNIYVTDYNNHRIQVFDKDLNFIYALDGKTNSRDLAFGYPTGAVVNSLGELYLIDTENKRILKFSTSGNFLLEFGGHASGPYTLENPLSISAGPDNSLFLLDGGKILYFDQFGSILGSTEAQFLMPFDLNYTDSTLTIVGKKGIYTSKITQLPTGTIKLDKIELVNEPETNGKLKSAFLINNDLFVLRDKAIEIYKKKAD